jgi:hypothetical protein
MWNRNKGEGKFANELKNNRFVLEYLLLYH